MMAPIDKDTVLDAFAAEPVHDRNTLERYVREYPHLAEELVDLSAELRLGSESPVNEDGIIVDQKLKGAWENFLAARPKPTAATAAADPFAQFKGTLFASLAEKLNTPRSFLTAVRDRLILPKSVPGSFVRRLAEATSTSFETVSAYLAQDSQAPLGLAFKSDEKPSRQERATFRQIVENTEMSEPQRLLLLRECEEHELT